MNHTFNISLLSVLLTGLVSAHAATYYVDYASGNDTNNGTATNSAWQHCPGDPNATGEANLTLSPGDTVVFRGGVTYSFSGTNDCIAVNASGTSGNPIRYVSGDQFSPQWGSAPAAINAFGASAVTNSAKSNGALSLGNYSWLVVDGLMFTNMLATYYNTAGAIGWCGTSGGNVTITNCNISNCGGNGIVIQGTWGPAASYPSNFTVANCTISNLYGHGVMLRVGLTNVLIEGCHISYPGHDVGVGGSPLADCIDLAYDTGAGSVQGGIIISNNWFGTVEHKSHILIQEPEQNLLVENNYFTGSVCVAAMDFTGSTINTTIRNNLFTCNSTTYEGTLRFYTDQGGNVTQSGINILNNIFVGTPYYDGIIWFSPGNSTTATFTNVSVLNNIFDTSISINQVHCIEIDHNGPNTGPVVYMPSFTCDYNTYWAPSPGTLFSYEGTNITTLAQWQSTIGTDAHSINGLPTFVSSTDFHLAPSDTLARGQGTNLFLLFSTDLDNNQRPSTGAWDIGAYESAANFLPPPTGFKVIPQ